MVGLETWRLVVRHILVGGVGLGRYFGVLLGLDLGEPGLTTFERGALYYFFLFELNLLLYLLLNPCLYVPAHLFLLK